ncbi:MAG: hypothetical protein WC910_08220 [Bacteroidales bacterium]|jgi:hypothetical protein
MSLKDLLYDKTDDHNSLSLTRTVAVVTFIVLSGGFILTAWKRASWEVFCAYPAGVMIVFVPQLFLRLVNKLEGVIKVWKGGSE